MANIDRRDFLKLVGAGSVGAGSGFMLAESIKHPVEYLIPAVIPPEDFSPGIVTWYNSVCGMCSAGCGISVRTREGRAKKIEGNPAHPVNQGRLCALGQAGLQVLYNPDRLTAPARRTHPRDSSFLAEVNWEQITWEEGLTTVAQRLKELQEGGQGDSICLLSEGVRGHLASLFELFMAQLGSDRLLHYDFSHPHSLYDANQHFFGEQVLPYYDVKNTHYLLSFGADYLGSWISPVHHSLGFGHSRQGQGGFRGQFVQIEPRMSISGAAADQWIAAKPGTEGFLALGIAHRIVSQGHYQGTDRADWAESLQNYSTDRVAEQTGVPADTIVQLADAFIGNRPSLAIGGGGAGSHSNGVDTLIAVNALNYLAGNIGKAGGLAFNPNPATYSTAATPHARAANYRKMLALAEDARRGKIQVLLLSGTNPVFSLPAAAKFQEALAAIPLVVSLSSFMDETTAMADLILPSHTYLESWGDDFPTPGVGFSTGSVSQPVVSPLYNTRATGDIILALAHKLNFNGTMPWPDMKDYLKASWREIYRRGPGQESFESFWIALVRAGVWGEKTRRESTGFVPDKQVVRNIGVTPPKFSGDSEAYPFILHPYLSIGLHDGRGANLPWMQELPDPLTSVVYGSWVELNPATAERLGFAEGDLVKVESPYGSITVPVYLYRALRPEVIAMPIGQGHSEYGRYAKDRGSNPIQILAPQMDTTGNLAWSATRVRLVATGEKVALVKTGGTSRQLGREIIQTTTSSAAYNAQDSSRIPLREV